MMTSMIRDLGYMLDLLLQVILRLTHLPKRWRWFTAQLYVSGIQTLHVVLLVGLFIGMIVALQTGIELSLIHI